MTKPCAPKFLLWLLVAVAVAATALPSCSPKKNNAATRKYQAFITRYNIYYNGDTHYKETLKEMEEGYQDDYSSLLFIHPAVARGIPRPRSPAGVSTGRLRRPRKPSSSAR